MGKPDTVYTQHFTMSGPFIGLKMQLQPTIHKQSKLNVGERSFYGMATFVYIINLGGLLSVSQ